MYNFRVTALICLLVVVWTNDAEASDSEPSVPNFDGTARDIGEGSQNGADSTLTNLIGNDVKTKPYDPMLYDGTSGGPVKGGDDLECKTGQVCCWANRDEHSVTTLKWQSAKGPTEAAKLQSSFNTQNPPGGNYLVAYSDTARGPQERALFESCSIACADGKIDVEFRYWVTAGVNLQVCTRNAFFDDTDQLSNCRNIETNKQSGLAKVTVPGGQLITVDIVASSFTSDTGSVAIVDHIDVSFKACPMGVPAPTPAPNPTTRPSQPAPVEVPAPTPAPNPTTRPPQPAPVEVPAPTPAPNPTTRRPQSAPVTAPTGATPSPGAVANDDHAINCPALRCNFDQDTMCGYTEYQLQRSSALRPTKGFAVRHGRFENFLTGATEPKDSGAYAAAYLYGRDSASLQSGVVDIMETRILHFYGYVATQGLRFKVCLDTDANCPLITSSDVKPANRKKWKSYNVLLPKGTKQVFIIAENTGQNEGAVGIDNIDLRRPLSRGPPDAEQSEGSTCEGGRRRIRK